MRTTNTVLRFLRHGSVLVWRVGAILAGAVMAGLGGLLAAMSSQGENEVVSPYPIAGKTDAWMEFQAGRLSGAELAYYESISDE